MIATSLDKLLYPRLRPYNAGRLQVSDLHEIYWEELGCPDGIPVIGLHGGPGGGGNNEMHRFFNPEHYRIILFDQRGCGRSSPYAELRDNTTWDLVGDMELLRRHIKVDSWLLFGGSWGSTLALAYASRHREAVTGMILRGIFLLTKAEISWFYNDGASKIFPDAFERFAAIVPEAEHSDMVAAYYRLLTGPDPKQRAAAARAWSQWEGDTLSLEGPSMRPSRFNDGEFQDAFARIECHYFVNNGFFEHDGWLLDQAGKFGDIPAIIIHGRYDMVTPLASAWKLKKAWPQARLRIIADAGHSSLEPGIAKALIEASNQFARNIGQMGSGDSG